MASPLQPFLDQLYTRYHRRQYLSSDPLEFVHQYGDAFDQEVVAFLSALLAYGNVKQIRASVTNALTRIHGVAASPREFVGFLAPDAEPSARRRAEAAFHGFVHRFNVGADLLQLFRLIGRSWREHGSVGSHFLSHLAPDAGDISAALDGLIGDWRRGTGARLNATSFSYLLTAPADGSCCKRWCMLLRWMGRDDSAPERLDLGLWTARSPLAGTFPPGRALESRQLVIPLDTHTGRISQYLGLTHRKSLNWLAAREVTESLRACNAEDPVRYDFALARLGILDLCQRQYREPVCTRCELLSVCRFARAAEARADRANRAREQRAAARARKTRRIAS